MDCEAFNLGCFCRYSDENKEMQNNWFITRLWRQTFTAASARSKAYRQHLTIKYLQINIANCLLEYLWFWNKIPDINSGIDELAGQLFPSKVDGRTVMHGDCFIRVFQLFYTEGFLNNLAREHHVIKSVISPSPAFCSHPFAIS